MCDHCFRMSGCQSWQALVCSSKKDRVDACAKRCGGRTVMLELSVEPSSKSGQGI